MNFGWKSVGGLSVFRMFHCWFIVFLFSCFCFFSVQSRLFLPSGFWLFSPGFRWRTWVEPCTVRNWAGCCNSIVGLHIYSLIDVHWGTQGYYYSNCERLTVNSWWVPRLILSLSCLHQLFMKHSQLLRELILLSRYFRSGLTFAGEYLLLPYLAGWVRLSGESWGRKDIAQMKPPDTAELRKLVS